MNNQTNWKYFMKIFVSTMTAFVLIATINTPAAMAGPAADKLTACLADNTTGKDRKDLASWVFAAMSTHPDIRSLSNVTEQERDDLDKLMAMMVTRLLTESCKNEAKVAIDKEGVTAFETAFGQMGKLAMKELMSNPNVNSAFSNYSKYLDRNKFNNAFSKK